MNNQNSPKPAGSELPKNNTSGSAKRRGVQLAVVFSLVVGVGFVAGSFLTRPKQDQPAPRTDKQERQLTVPEQADKINFEGDYEKAQAFLDENIAKTSDPKEKGGLYETKSLFALNAKKYEESLKFAQKAEEIHPTTISAGLVAKSAEGLGDKKLAIEYYRKVLDLLPPPTIEEDRQYYRDKIKALGG